MIHLIKILLFLLVNLGGYNVINMLVWMTVTLGIYPSLPRGQDYESFQFLLLDGGFFIWLLCAIASAGYFVIRHKELRTWLILAPLYGTFTYGAGLMIFYNFKTLVL